MSARSNSKISSDKLERIAKAYKAGGRTHKEVAEQFGVSTNTVWKAVHYLVPIRKAEEQAPSKERKKKHSHWFKQHPLVDSIRICRCGKVEDLESG